MRKSLLRPGSTFKPSSSNLKSHGDRDDFSRASGRSSRGAKDDGHKRSKRSRSRSPLVRSSNLSSRDRGHGSSHENLRGYGKARSRSGSRDGPPPRSKSGGGIGLIAQAREQMRLIQTGKLRMDMDSPSRHGRSSGRPDHGPDHGARDKAREPIRKSLLDRMGERKHSAGLDIGKRGSNSNSVFANLDRVVKKAREERSGVPVFSTKQSGSVHDRASDKWGHSGYEEMYHVEKPSTSRGNVRLDSRRRSPSRSRSPRRERDLDVRRGSGHQSFDSKLPRIGNKRSRSLSRSPAHKRRPIPRGDGGRRISPLLSRKPDSFVAIKKSSSECKRGSLQQDGRRHSDIKTSRGNTRGDNGPSRIGNGTGRSRQPDLDSFDGKRSKLMANLRSSKTVKSVIQSSKPNLRLVPRHGSGFSGRGRPAERRSFSGSMTDSSRSRTPSPQLKRPNSGKPDVKGQAHRRTSTRSRSRSNVRSTSSESSSDEDVLELHPRDGRRKSGSLSRSSRSSSSEGSNSGESVERESLGRRTGSSSSSSSSSGSDSEDMESDKHSVAMAKDKDRTRANQAAAPVAPPRATSASVKANAGTSTGKQQQQPLKRVEPSKPSKQTSDIDSDSSTPSVVENVKPKSNVASSSASKSLPKSTTTAVSKSTKTLSSSVNPKKKVDPAPPPNPAPKKTTPAKPKDPEPVSADSDSESESSSESDDEPRMTLSERFAKLTQMSTDKREFAKPEISASDIDTKLKVVKDLRSADTRIYVNGITPSDRDRDRGRLRPKSPEHGDGEPRYSSDDRRRHFERMTRDEPRERPVDWSDVRVRYGYYKDRGYFDERPLSLDEYVKWEAWWYQYRDWLAGEGYYDNNPEPHYEESNERDVRTNWRHSHEDQHQHQGGSGTRSLVSAHRRIMAPNEPVPLMDRPIHFGGRRGHDFHRHPRDISPPSMGSYHVPMSRRIGHAVGGSLVVNIRQGSYNNRGRGRLAGRIGVRRN